MRHLLLTASLGVALAASSFAARAGNADPDSYFINAGAGISHSNLDGLTDKNSWGYGLNFGYRWQDTWGVEAGYVDLGKPEAKGYYAGYPYAFKLHVSGFTLGGNGRWRLSDNWHATARLGVFFSKSKVTASGAYEGEASDNDTNVYVGGGVSYDFSPTFSMGLNIDRYQAKAKRFITGTNSPYVASATLEWRFGVH
jgi:hypothetical protein